MCYSFSGFPAGKGLRPIETHLVVQDLSDALFRIFQELMTKEAVSEELVSAVRTIMAGRKYVSHTLADRLAREVRKSTEKPVHELLSDREYQVMSMLARGRTVNEISEELNLSVKTISTYRSRLLKKLKMKNNAEVMYYAMKQGLVE